MLKLSPSILSSDFSRLGEEVALCEREGAQYIHIDVMDGMFVPNITLGAPVVKSIRKCSNAIFDVHLMVEDPGRYISDFAKAGADIITVHYEATKHIDRVIQQIHEEGKKAGIALNPGTPVSVLEDILSDLDMVLIMSVNPGFGGQKFIPYVLNKIRNIKIMSELKNPSLEIEVDGGVSFENINEIIEAGANVFVAGSSVFNGDASKNIKHFLQCFESYCNK
ncbi:MAG: ribulose-phosphate 3-epimerase [Eubacteriales bacterium]|nr:ribulose-phosphate 3-epimerase [Eubacteriales bacterium]